MGASYPPDSTADPSPGESASPPTFLFTDIVGSTALWDKYPAAMKDSLLRHNWLVAEAVERSGGRLIQSMGEGDSTVSVFARATDGIRAALAANAALAAEMWPHGIVIRIRAALHTAPADLRNGRYFGPALNRAARLRSLAEANEVVLSAATAELVAGRLPHGVDLVDLGEHALRGFGERERVHALAGAYISTPPLAVCPYRGLGRFEQSHADLFFGRRAKVAEALERLRAHPVLAVVGASGSGKSSLARAGIVPAALAGGLPGVGLAVTVVPGSNPNEALDRAFGDSTGAAAQVLLVVDQFEEIFTRCSNPDERARFVTRLLRSGMTTVLVVRADFYGHCASIPGLAAEVVDHQLLLGPMSEDELREAIVEPARAVGLRLEPGLPELLIGDVLGQPGALPLLSHALVETWERRDGRTLTLAGYRAAGGARGAIARTADVVYSGFDPIRRRAARRVFLRLVEPGQGTEDTRRRATLDELTGEGAAADVSFVLEELASARLITVDDYGVEVAHEALIREWPLLRRWLEEDRERLRLLRALTNASNSWTTSGRDSAELFRGARLAAAESLDVGDLTPTERAFLAASREAADREHEELRGRVIEQERTNRRLRRLLAVVALALSIAAIAGTAAIVQGQRAGREANAARAANSVASEQLARGLAASASDLAGSNPFLATVLAVEAMGRVRPALPEARRALVESRTALAGRQLAPIGDLVAVGDAQTVSVRGAGDLAATGNRNGSIDLWDIARREHVAQLTGPSGGINRMTFTGDGRWLFGASVDHKVWRWDLTLPLSGDRLRGRVLADLASVVWAVAATQDGKLVAAATQAGNVALLDAATGQAIGQPFGGGLMSVAFSPDGSTLVAGSLRGEVFAWSLSTRELRFPPIAAHEGLVWEVVVNDEADTPGFVTASTDGTVRMWDLNTGARLGNGPFDAGATGVPVGVLGVTFGADRNVLTVGGPDGAVYSWSLPERRVVASAGPAHHDQIRSAARSSDGLTLVTLADDRTLQVWTERTRRDPLVRFPNLGVRPTALAASSDGTSLAVGTADGWVRLLDADSGTELKRLNHGPAAVTAVAFDDRRVMAGSADGSLRAWDVESGHLLAEKPGAHRDGVSAITVANRGTRALVGTGGGDGQVRIWNERLNPIGSPMGTPGSTAVTDVVFADSGDSIIATTRGGSVAQWTMKGDRLSTLTESDDTVWAVAAGSGDTIATGSADETLSVWSLEDAARPKRIRDLGSHGGGALDVVFVDGISVAAGAGDGRLRLWDAVSGMSLGQAVDVSNAPVRYVVAAPGGLIWTASDDGSIARMDFLAVSVACEEAVGSFDRGQRDRLLAGRAPLGCAGRK